MKKTLRMLCMGAMAAFSAVSFAQTNVTDKLLNPDAEKGMLGWDVTFVDGGQVWNKQTKGEEKAPGYYGFDNWAFENWRGAGTALTNSSIFQVVKDLPNGTYVFGAYAMATNDSWEPSIDAIEGVSIFANEQSIPVATHRVEGMDERWAYAMKFNVATTVADGTITVGMKTQDCTTNFVAMDNATLWYFGEMSYEQALEEMAKVDVAAAVAKNAPYLEAGKMNVDTLALLQAAVEAAANVSAETANDLIADLYWGKRQAKKSIAQYEALANAIAAAKVIAEGEWTDFETTVAALETLNALIADAEAMYEAATAEKAELAATVTALGDAAALVELDGCYTLLDVYTEKMDEMVVGDEIGEYTADQADEALAYWEEASLVLAMAEAGELSPVTAKQDCEKYFAKIDQIIANPIDYSEFPIFLHRGDTLLPNQGSGERNQAYKVLDGSYVENIPAGTNNDGGSYGARNGVIHYKSPLFRFREPLTKVRFIVHEVGAPFQTATDGRASFCLGSFAMYDEHDNEIELTTENLVTNANEPKEGKGILGLLDGDPGTFFHSLWSAATPQAHYLEVTLPEGEYSAFSFKMVALSQNHSRAFPAEVEITYVSDIVTELQQTIVSARTNYNPVFGTAPGFYNFDLTPYKNALLEGDAVAEKNGVSDAEAQAALNKVNAVLDELEEKGVMLPEAGKKYRIISSEPAFVKNQLVHKAWTIHETDTTYANWLWWEDAGKDSVKQEFSFELIEKVDGKLYYTIKHEATGLYLADWRDEEGNLPTSMAVFTLSENPDPFEVRHIGAGEWIFVREGYSSTILHMLNHNSGVANPDIAAQQGVGNGKGFSSCMIIWNNAAYDYSGFYIREMMELPCATKSFSDLNFSSQTYTVYDGVNTLTLTADKESAFENLVFTNGWGNTIAPQSVEVAGNVATVIFADAIGEFQFMFDNAEGVAEVVVDGSYIYRGVSAAFTALQNKYNTVLAVAPVEGEDVGQVANLSEYNDALAIAEGLLAEGGDDAALEAATAALDSAQAHLVYNLPKADVDYLILLGLDAIKGNHLTDMAIFADAEQAIVRWTYVSLTNDAYRWRFIDCGEQKHGRAAYYLQNVATECYAARSLESNNPVYLYEDTTEVRPYNIFFINKGKVALGDTYWADGAGSLHPLSHGSGAAANKGNKMITWGRTDAASAMYVVEAEKYITDVVYSINGIENIDVTDEFVAPAVKGTFDLFGRRIDTPATTGIYIIDGKKRVVKK